MTNDQRYHFIRQLIDHGSTRKTVESMVNWKFPDDKQTNAQAIDAQWERKPRERFLK